MIPARDRIRHSLLVRLLALEYWFDRLTEWRRLLVGAIAIFGLALGLLYVLGATSVVMVNRADADAADIILEPAGGPELVLSVPRVGQRRATSTPTPVVDGVANLIQPPDVPEVPIIPPRFVYLEPLNPRAIEPAASPPPAAASPVAAQAARPGSPVPAPAGQATATPRLVATATPRPSNGTATPTRPPGASAQTPQPTATPRRPVAPTATPQPR